MKILKTLTLIYILITISATVCLSIEEYSNYNTSEPLSHRRVKRKGNRIGRIGKSLMNMARSSSERMVDIRCAKWLANLEDEGILVTLILITNIYDVILRL